VAERIDYDERQYAVYAQGRALPAPRLAEWMQTFARHAGRQPPLAVLDLGCGTGRFTHALAETFGGPVYGVEPSTRMREVAERSARHPNVTYLAGAAERIPLPDSACDLILLFLVLHHVQDRRAAAAEIARVLRPGGRLLLSSTFPDRRPHILWHRYFPGARAIEQELFPTLTEVTRLFTAAGLRTVTVERVRQLVTPTLAEYAARLRLRAISTFERLTEEEIDRGFAALDADVAAETVPQPVRAEHDLLVMARPGG
jgi:ubiquinone/menaquinone biosynthesis C-methylase UbiE